VNSTGNALFYGGAHRFPHRVPGRDSNSGSTLHRAGALITYICHTPHSYVTPKSFHNQVLYTLYRNRPDRQVTVEWPESAYNCKGRD
jgi:hypothetical protein